MAAEVGYGQVERTRTVVEVGETEPERRMGVVIPAQGAAFAEGDPVRAMASSCRRYGGDIKLQAKPMAQ